MAPYHPTAREEREKKVQLICSFASSLAGRFDTWHDRTLDDDIQNQIRGLPLPASSAVTAKQGELEKLGTELWNLSTRLRRDEDRSNNTATEELLRKKHAVGLLRVYSFLLLDSAGSQSIKRRERKNCIRLIKVALKAAKWCLENKEMEYATKVLERAAEYQDVLGQEQKSEDGGEAELGERLRVEYFALRTALAWASDRMDTAEHMFTKCKRLSRFFTAPLAEDVADLLYEMGKDFLSKHSYEATARWLERAHDILGEQSPDMLSAEAGELKLSIMQSTIQAYIKLNSPETHTKAWQMFQLLEAEYEDKMSIALLKLELLYSENTIDPEKVYMVLHRMILFIVLNERNFQTMMHHIHKLKNLNAVTACRLVNELIETRLFREEKEAWLEKAVVTSVWISCTMFGTEETLDQVRELFDNVLRDMKTPFSAQATHAAQTLLWKQVEAKFSQGHHREAETWCGICLHSLFDKAGETNKSKIARKMVLCALARHDYTAAREVFSRMSDSGREDRMTRYLMYKVALHGKDTDLAAECLDSVHRQSSKDTSLLYACVIEAQQSGNKREGIAALEKMLEKYNDGAPADVHLPALLRMTARLLISELVKEGKVNDDVFEQVCKTFEGASTHAKASRRRPSNSSREQFNAGEFEWFSKNSYNLAVKYCAEVHPSNLVQLLVACVEFIKLLKDCDHLNGKEDNYNLRSMFCHYLLTCAFAALARAEDNMQHCIQYYLQVSKHGREFRLLGAETIGKLNGSSKADMTAKHFQVVKLGLEAALKREQWEDLDDLFEECWKYGDPTYYDTLADLVLVMYSCMSRDNVDSRHQTKVLSVLQKIINASGKGAGFDIVKMSRWIRCLFQMSLTYDETVSLKCVDHAIRIASLRKGEPNHYPATELEWLSTTTFNHAVDYYVQGNDENCKLWAEKAITLADWAEDKNKLGSVLMEKFKGLAWDNEELLQHKV